MQLERIIGELRGMRPEMVTLANAMERRDNIGYFRPIQPEERMADVMAEAAANGSIVASKGEVICIVPKLPEGWTQIFGRRRTDSLMAIREQMEEVDEH